MEKLGFGGAVWYGRIWLAGTGWTGWMERVDSMDMTGKGRYIGINGSSSVSGVPPLVIEVHQVEGSGGYHNSHQC